MSEGPVIPGLKMKPEYAGRKVELVKVGRGHRYRVDGVVELLSSVTTLTGVLNKPALVGWARRDTAGKMKKRLLAVEPGNYPGEDTYAPYIDEIVADATRDDPTARDDGTYTHAMIEEAITGRMPELEIDVDDARRERCQLAIDAGLRMIEEELVEVVGIEIPVWHPHNMYAGTIDLLGKTSTGALVVWDWKRSSGHYKENALQVCAYTEALTRLAEPPAPEIIPMVAVIPRTKKDGRGSVKAIDPDDYMPCIVAFEWAMGLYRAMADIKMDGWR